jgi:hypothetical protein
MERDSERCEYLIHVPALSNLSDLPDTSQYPSISWTSCNFSRFSKRFALDAGVFGIFEPRAFEKKDVKLFCFEESVETVSLDDIAVTRDQKLVERVEGTVRVW